MPSSIKVPNLGMRIVCKVAERKIFLTPHPSERSKDQPIPQQVEEHHGACKVTNKIFQSFPECLCQDILLLMWMSSCPDLTMIKRNFCRSFERAAADSRGNSRPVSRWGRRVHHRLCHNYPALHHLCQPTGNVVNPQVW